MQIKKPQEIVAYVIKLCPENFSFQPLTILWLFLEICYFQGRTTPSNTLYSYLVSYNTIFLEVLQIL